MSARQAGDATRADRLARTISCSYAPRAMSLRVAVGMLALAIGSAGCACSDETSSGSPGAGGVAGAAGAAGTAGAGADSGADSGAADAGNDGPVNDADAPAATRGTCAPLDFARSYGGSAPGALFDLESARAVTRADTLTVFAGQLHGEPDLGGGALVAGADNRSMFVLALDAMGVHAFSRTFGDPSPGLLYAPQATAADVAPRRSGGVVLAGSFAGSIDFGAGTLVSAEDTGGLDAGLGCLLSCAPDAVLVALDAAGNTEWSVSFGGFDGDAASAVATDPTGTVYATGSFRGTIDLGGHVATSRDGADVFVAAFDDATGAPTWLRTFGGSGDDAGRALAVAADGSIVVAGAFSGSVDFGSGAVSPAGAFDGFVLRLDATGSVIGSRALGASHRGTLVGAVSTSAGIVLTGAWRGEVGTGASTLTSDRNDALVWGLDDGLSDRFLRGFGTGADDEATGIAADATGRLAVTGTLGFGVVDLGGGTLAGNLNDSAFLLELDAEGAHVCSRRYLAEARGELVNDVVSVGGALDGNDVAFDARGSLAWAGALSGKTAVDGVAVESSGGSDAFVARFTAQ